ncbi:MAG TPA: TAXI family TRAP transporter solute-binding subunit [Xanthobacteraceae bacterium]|nr:TAXI family TRAP transporter solute-binding subunit [Xanthobacteraceae bacterium]
MSHVLRSTLLALAALGFSAGAHAQTYGIATMQPGTLNHTTGSAIARVLKEKGGMNMLVQATAGESVLLPLVHRGEIDLGIANIAEAVEAYEGRARAGKQDKLRMIGALHPLRTPFFVRKDSNIKSVGDLRGKRVPLGFSAMGTINTTVLAMLAGGNLTERDVRPVLVPNVIRGAEEFASGAADNFFFALGGAKVNEVDATVGGVRVLNIPDTPQVLEAMRKIFPYVYLTAVSPRPGLTGVLEPVNVFSYDNVLVVSADTKDEVVYKILDTLAKNKPELVLTAPQLNEFSIAGLYKKYPVPYHPGAIKYFQDNKVEPRS